MRPEVDHNFVPRAEDLVRLAEIDQKDVSIGSIKPGDEDNSEGVLRWIQKLPLRAQAPFFLAAEAPHLLTNKMGRQSSSSALNTPVKSAPPAVFDPFAQFTGGTGDPNFAYSTQYSTGGETETANSSPIRAPHAHLKPSVEVLEDLQNLWTLDLSSIGLTRRDDLRLSTWVGIDKVLNEARSVEGWVSSNAVKASELWHRLGWTLCTLMFTRKHDGYTIDEQSFRRIITTFEILAGAYPEIMCFLLPLTDRPLVPIFNLQGLQEERGNVNPSSDPKCPRSVVGDYSFRGPLVWLMHMIEQPRTEPECLYCEDYSEGQREKVSIAFGRLLNYISDQIDLLTRLRELPPHGGDIYPRYVAHLVTGWITTRPVQNALMKLGQTSIGDLGLVAVGLMEDAIRKLNLWSEFSPFKSGLAVEYPHYLTLVPTALYDWGTDGSPVIKLKELKGDSAIEVAVWALLKHAQFQCWFHFQPERWDMVLVRARIEQERLSHTIDRARVVDLTNELQSIARLELHMTRLLEALSQSNGRSADNISTPLWTCDYTPVNRKTTLKGNRALYSSGTYHFCSHPQTSRGDSVPWYRFCSAVAARVMEEIVGTRSRAQGVVEDPTVDVLNNSLAANWAKRMLQLTSLNRHFRDDEINQLVTQCMVRAQQMVLHRLIYPSQSMCEQWQMYHRAKITGAAANDLDWPPIKGAEPAFLALMGLTI